MDAIDSPTTYIVPQPKQNAFLSSCADIAIYGGANYGGKTFALILESLRHLHDKNYRCVFFRRTYPDIFLPGGLWDESLPLYTALGGRSAWTVWKFPSGAKIQFSHLQHEKDIETWKGSQVTLFCFDQLEEFTDKMLWYIGLSRGRSKANASSYIRATCNPDPDSFLASLLAWWIDENTGYPIAERSGVLRWFYRKNNIIHWFDSKEDAQVYAIEKNYIDDKGYPEKPVSLTFIASTLKDNPIGMEMNPMYEASLKALAYVDMERLLYGNWKIRESAGNVFRRSFFEIVEDCPAHAHRIRYWDRAATVKSKNNPDPDYTVGLLLGFADGIYYVIDIERFRGTPYEVEQAIVNLGKQDGLNVMIILEQDPGQAGKFEKAYYETALHFFNFGFSQWAVASHGNKIVRSKNVASASQHGKVKVVRGEWNDEFLLELENFPDGKHDDQVDAFSGAFYEINRQL